MSTTTLTVRMDAELKQQFTTVVESLGLDAPTVVRMLAVQTVRQQRVPLSLSANLEVNSSENETLDFLDSVRSDWGEW
ncbi:MAG: type II toxin-antitoxin system RelB/DinJ family antitoxin [Propionibacteriaceae bacterium]|jgi:DNA-damage-inducible protein J|nr:type II toxin-antitoxin system RelB/DinJ family antitoxin [Propionibacteriaceae bacterium]